MIEVVLNRLSTGRRLQYAHYIEQIRDGVNVFTENRMATVAMVIVLATLLMAVFAPFIAPYEPTETVYNDQGQPETLQPPTVNNPMGTNHLAQDIYSQWIYGSRVSLLVGFLSAITVISIGTTVGLVSGYYKGLIDLVLMRVVDILYAIPATPLVLVVAMFWGSSVWTVIIAMMLVLWRTSARLIRSETMSLAEQPFVKAARASGASDMRIMFVHIAPILVPIMLIEGTFVAGSAILLEAGISFLGLGATEMMSWGVMLQLTFSSGAISVAWWWVLPPGLSITALVVSFFYISRGIEDVTNPQIE
ncbi:ABC transporter permease [Halobaculum magnesiiphilum]|uniref:ABC transporter permease n=1 Tax=Halobaculum magnesiiphilum TaxID=1017351 RepID=A0A8T8WIR6_9EURY|nr:ABC transporter permease [Halobaculum magnesiiphilum]QZP39765.1 ABC transporter permease [Halobaculum magnesiiphilum]